MKSQTQNEEAITKWTISSLDKEDQQQKTIVYVYGYKGISLLRYPYLWNLKVNR